jgi:hypothetical protein
MRAPWNRQSRRCPSSWKQRNSKSVTQQVIVSSASYQRSRPVNADLETLVSDKLLFSSKTLTNFEQKLSTSLGLSERGRSTELKNEVHGKEAELEDVYVLFFPIMSILPPEDRS